MWSRTFLGGLLLKTQDTKANLKIKVFLRGLIAKLPGHLLPPDGELWLVQNSGASGEVGALVGAQGRGGRGESAGAATGGGLTETAGFRPGFGRRRPARIFTRRTTSQPRRSSNAAARCEGGGRTAGRSSRAQLVGDGRQRRERETGARCGGKL